ncbi:hypothetical protein C0J52_00297 [Blattella germanica]|nr:hypothetical protein C0J52_00297 [Blattella germanica]
MENTEVTEEEEGASAGESTTTLRRQHAVCVRDAYKQFGTKRNKEIVLKGLNMTVPVGVIYGLLGASGCGKTTLLSCIVGRKRLDSGEIWVLGGKPGTKGSGVPGPRVGYMPQETALNELFSIRETFLYFGWLCGMKKKDILDKLNFYLNILDLPISNRLVKNLSAGQQRRVSLAVTMVQDPDLLILDEPTVGVDPVIREKIWIHLTNMAKTNKFTIIITTHYIEETRKADLVGLMRDGHFLAENSPDYLIEKYQTKTLEEVFLKLSIIQEEVKENVGKERKKEINRGNKPNVPEEKEERWTMKDLCTCMSIHRARALIWKNFVCMWRNIAVMVFLIALPIVETVLFCLTVGPDPKNLPVSYVNDELEFSKPCLFPKEGCSYRLLSCRYLRTLEIQTTLKLTRFKRERDALDLVKRGKSWGVLHFNSNYSESMKQRVLKGYDVTKKELADSQLVVRLDMTNQHISYMIKKNLYDAYVEMITNLLINCSIDPRVLNYPLKMHEPIYGPRNPNFTDFSAPGLITSLVFFLGVALAISSLLAERRDGLLQRCLVLGVTPFEILISLSTSQFLLLLLQIAMVLIFAFPVFNLILKGSILLLILLILLIGINGKAFGYTVASLVDSDRTATYVAMGSFLPMLLLCGICWPIEGMHYILRIISNILPLTFITESLRAIMGRGWDLQHKTVWVGFVSTLGWTVMFLIMSILLLKFKK